MKPGLTDTSWAVALPTMVPLLRMLMFTNGIVHEYAVGLVKLTLVSRVNVETVVRIISRDPIWGLRLVAFAPGSALARHQCWCKRGVANIRAENLEH